MEFTSDNTTGAHPRIMAAIQAANNGRTPSYGDDPWTLAMERAFDDLFETETRSLAVATGIAANSIGLAACGGPGGVVLCHAESHIVTDECGAPTRLSDGLRLMPLPGDLGKLSADTVQDALADRFGHGVHSGRPMVLSITNLNEYGQAYTPAEIGALAEVAHSNGLKLHVDGARFANAVSHLGCTPAELTWKAGVDVMSFGGTKNGCWCAEAVVFFDRKAAETAPFIRMRAGHLLSKGRLLASQFIAYLEDGLWLELAGISNVRAAKLAAGLKASGKATLMADPMGNEVYAIWPKATGDRLRDAGALFYPWAVDPAGSDFRLQPGMELARLVTGFTTSEAEVEQLVGLVAAS
ncbi:MAG TPA: beta-eliminating lyase-related protein [Devosiaceae bacterium]